MSHKPFFLLLLSLIITRGVNAQINSSVADSLTASSAVIVSKYIDRSTAKAEQLQQKLDRKSEKALQQMQKLEIKMQRKLARFDSSKAKQLFGNVKQQYDHLEQRLNKSGSSQNIPSLDSLTIAINFLKQNPKLLLSVRQSQQKLKEVLSKAKGAQSQFQKAEDIKAFLRERKQYLKEQLTKLGFARQLKKINKHAYYYSQQVAEYKDIINDQEKIERKALELLSKTRLFKDFISKNSMLAGLFPGQSTGAGNISAQTGFAALQTRAQVTAFIQQSTLGAAGSTPRIQQNIQDAQAQVTDLRNKIYQLTGRNGNDLELPDFKPNTQKTKSFLKRLEYGFNVQSQKGSLFFPATSDLGLSVGYKLNDKSIIGIGASYKIGWGTGWKHIALSHQGAGLRSFIEWKVKDGFGLSGGYEMNYRDWPEASVIPPPGGWKAQQSGLIGLYKSIPLKTKFFKKTKLQLLWDFLSYQQRPQTQPIIFRVGYNF